ncbi:MAG TPA: HEAT repeat domain-containing protein [Planctomycetota bacterium]|nr:HEAT repeat domain-containing protein [Planctomycetota bacterium]
MDPSTRATIDEQPVAPASPFPEEGRAPELGLPLDEEPAQHVPGGFLSALPQFFVFPLILVATLTAAWLGLRLLVGGSPDDAREVLAEIRSAAGPHGRWQAMHELADGLRRGSLNLDAVPASELAALWAEFGTPPPPGVGAAEREQAALTRQWLLAVLQWKRAPELTAIALSALSDEDGTVRLSALAALAEMRDPAAREALAGVLRDGSDEERFIALAALGRLAAGGDGAAADAVADQLGQGDGVLQRNAILALADAGDARSAPGLPALLVRANYDGDASLDGPDAALRDEDSRAAARATVVEQFLVSACRAAGKSRDPALGPLLRALEADDPSLKVRSAALGALHDRGESPENS